MSVWLGEEVEEVLRSERERVKRARGGGDGPRGHGVSSVAFVLGLVFCDDR